MTEEKPIDIRKQSEDQMSNADAEYYWSRHEFEATFSPSLLQVFLRSVKYKKRRDLRWSTCTESISSHKLIRFSFYSLSFKEGEEKWTRHANYLFDFFDKERRRSETSLGNLGSSGLIPKKILAKMQAWHQIFKMCTVCLKIDSRIDLISSTRKG